MYKRQPNGSFYKGEGKYQVFVFDSENRAVRRTVHAGDCNRDYVEILDGLQPGDKIIVSDTEQYNTKNKLNIKWE